MRIIDWSSDVCSSDLGDFLAMLGAARIGEREILDLAAEIGWDQLDAFRERWFDYSEQSMIDAIAKLPSGRVSATSTHDPIAGKIGRASCRERVCQYV